MKDTLTHVSLCEPLSCHVQNHELRLIMHGALLILQHFEALLKSKHGNIPRAAFSVIIANN